MDSGAGGLQNTLGLGPDGIFGSTDDVDVDLGTDILDPAGDLTGVEDTLNTTAHGLSSGTIASAVTGVKFLDRDRDGFQQPGEPGLGGFTIYNDANNNARPRLG